MAEKYYSILTNRGKELEAQSSATGKPVIIKDFVVGDGNGQPVKPDPAQTKLVREVYRNAISALQVSPDQANQFIAQLVLAAGVGGFVVREVGLLTDAGELYSVANCAAIEKPENGVSVNLQYRLAVSESVNIELKVATGDGLFLRQDANLSDVKDASLSRKSLGLKGAAVLDVGITVGTVAAGDDTRIVNALQKNNNLSELTDKAKARTNLQLKTAAVADVQTSKDDITAGRVLANGGALAVRTVAAKADATGINVTDANNLPGNSVSFLYPTADNSAGINGSLLSFSGLSGNYPVQITASYNDGKNIKFRTYNGDAAQKWNPWYDIYHSGNKPTAADVNAIPLTGSNDVKGVVRNSAEFQSTSANSYRMVGGGYGTFWRNDGNNLYLMLTNKDDAYGSYNALRPLWVNLETGSLQSGTPLIVNNTITAAYSGPYAWAEQYQAKAAFYNSYSTAGTSEYHAVIKQQATVAGKNSWAFSMGSLVAGAELSWHLHMKGSGSGEVNYKWDVNGNFTAPGQIFPGSFANFDSRYYTKSQSDAGYMPKTGAYTKAESDARYQPKGSFAPPNTMGSSSGIIWWRCGSTGNMRISGVVGSVTNGGRVTFPTAFPNSCAAVVANNNSDVGSGGAAMQPYNVDRTGFNLRIAGGGTVRLIFVAEGN